MEASVTERTSRQAGILPPDKMANMTAYIAGCGAVGRQVALQLASAGIGRLVLYDFDRIEEANLYPQGWPHNSIGRLKVDELADQINSHYGETVVSRNPCRVPLTGLQPPTVAGQQAMFLCVDGIETRGRLFEAHRDNVSAFFDSRVAAETIRVVSACDSASKSYYSDTLFARTEAFEGACTSRMTIHSANIAAGLLIQQFSKWLREMPVDQDFILNLLSMELMTPEVARE